MRLLRKVKMVEGMFAGKAIVTTPVGAEGISGKMGSDYFVAITPEEFADRIIQLLQEDGLAQQMGKAARKTAEEYHDLSRVTGKLSDFYRSIL